MVMNEASALGMSASSIHTSEDENAQGSKHLRKQPKKVSDAQKIDSDGT